jgi:hypothetical protein
MQLWFSKISINKKIGLIRCLVTGSMYAVIFSNIIFTKHIMAKDIELNVTVSIDETNKRWEVEASMQIQLAPLAFIELLDSSPSDCNWMHNCMSVTLLAKPNISTRHIQTRINSPWPFSDRLMVTQSLIEYNEDVSEVTVYIESLSPTQAQKALEDTVLINNPRGIWQLLKKNNAYQLTYIGSADADKAIPSFMLKSSLMTSTTKTFQNIYNKLNKPIKESIHAQ